MAGGTGGEFYQKFFDPKQYLKAFYSFGTSSVGDEYLKFVLSQFSKTFQSGGLEGHSLIDIGTGPTIYQLLSACETFKEITVTDYADMNRQEIEKWINNEPEAFDWSPVVKFVCELEGDRKKPTEKDATLRKSIKQVLKCDVLKAKPLNPIELPLADCVLSCACMEGACKDLQEYHIALKNITTLLKPGGHLVLVGPLSNSYYMVGQVRFSAVYLKEGIVKEALTKAGYVIEKFTVSARPDDEMKEAVDFTGSYFAVARKL